MSYIPKYIIKRMFPRDTCLQLVKFKGEDYVRLEMLNVISPISVPAPPYDLGNLNLPADVGKFIKIAISGINVPVTPEIFLNDFSLWSQGKQHTWDSVMKGSAAGVNIPVGGKLVALIRKKAFPKEVQAKMVDGAETEVKVDVTVDNPMSIAVTAVLHVTGEFDASKT